MSIAALCIPLDLMTLPSHKSLVENNFYLQKSTHYYRWFELFLNWNGFNASNCTTAAGLRDSTFKEPLVILNGLNRMKTPKNLLEMLIFQHAVAKEIFS